MYNSEYGFDPVPPRDLMGGTNAPYNEAPQAYNGGQSFPNYSQPMNYVEYPTQGGGFQNTIPPQGYNGMVSPYAYNVPPSENNKRAKKKKRKKRRITFLIFILIALVAVGFHFGREYIANEKNKATLIVDGSWADVELTDAQKLEDWNNDGIPNGKAVELGLDPSAEDTDGDGLSDADEINKYNSDPTKYSTAGDGYSDGWKVHNGYHPSKYVKQIGIPLEENPKIILNPKEDGDSEKYVYKASDVRGIPSINQTYIDCFTLYSYNGDVEYKTDNPDMLKVYSVGLFDFKLLELETTKTPRGVVFENVANTKILVYDSVLDINGLSSPNAHQSNDYDQETEFYLVMSPLFNFTGKYPIYVFYDSKNSNIDDEQLSANITSYAKQAWADRCTEAGEDSEQTYEIGSTKITVGMADFEFHGVSGIALGVVKSVCGDFDARLNSIMTVETENNDETSFLRGLKSLLWFTTSYKGSINNLLLQIMGDEVDNPQGDSDAESSLVDYSVASEWGANKNSEWYADSGFDMSKHAFRFSNLATDVSNGLCAGFATETTRIFNGDKFDTNPNPFEHLDITHSYDYSEGVYDFVRTKNLYRYKPSSQELASYCDTNPEYEHITSDALPKPDKEVVKSLEYWWAWLNNEAINCSLASLVRGTIGIQQNTKFETVENLRDEFNKGHIVSVLLTNMGRDNGEFVGGGHAINAYKLEQSVYSEDLFYIRCYDNNMPCNKWVSADGVKNLDVTIYVVRTYEKDFLGRVHEKFVWAYAPIDANQEYSWTNAESNKYDSIYFLDGFANIY